MTLGEAPIKHLLVDLDGTLLGNKTFPLQLDFAGRALKSLKQYGGLRKRLRALTAVHHALRSPSKDATNDLRAIEVFSRLMEISQEEGRRLLRESLSVIFPPLEKHFFPVPGAKDFLAWAHGRFPLTLATNPVWPASIVELRLRWAGVDPKLFTRVTSVNTMHACKPEAMYYEEVLALEKLKPEDCLLIGDDLKMDLPATRVGIRVFIVGEEKKDGDAKKGRKTPAKTAAGAEALKPVSGARARGWRGTYSELREALEPYVPAQWVPKDPEIES